MINAGRGLPKSPRTATVTRSPRLMSRAGPAFDIVQGGVEERRQVLIRKIGRGGKLRLAAAFLGKARTPRVGNPDLDRSKTRLAKRRAALANPGRSGRRHDQSPSGEPRYM